MKLGDGVETGHSQRDDAELSSARQYPVAAALAEFHGVSTSYLLKHLQAMSGAGLLEAVPGP